MSDSSGHGNHVPSRLMRESLVDKDVIAGTESPVVRILPHLNVIQIGGKNHGSRTGRVDAIVERDR